ncbi:hypothetical protein BGZ80_006753 [Entomortierella chlamydospora]|uniref:RING-CH-type domain-containing protein n=1 Tax=Entomortierella chlamydospora TaxID=101097 RepID=A0A9P6MYL5_9FUNG|nr:hypothetical protein BGZ79_004792 [Entomortierella chlamydospora]KAG0018778.1 hypothetical protein BGZ80_006753 [Entomortierella chlamydospora]
MAAPAVSADDKQNSTLLDENDYDELVDEDWLDMDNPSSAYRSSQKRTPLSSSANDDQRVPAYDSPTYGGKGDAETPTASPSAFSFHSDFEDGVSRPTDLAPSTLATVVALNPSDSLNVLTKGTPKQREQRYIPESTSPASTSDSDYSLLSPSTEQSRKNSLSGSAGVHPLTSSHSTTSANRMTEDPRQGQSQDYDLEQEQADQQIAAFTGSSFSDFVQVASDHGEDFSGIESISARSSNNETSSSASSDGKGVLDEDDETKLPGTDILGLEKTGDQTIASGNDAKVAGAETQAGVAVTFSTSALPISTKRAMYRTTVEDAENSEDEQNSGGHATGMRYRGPSSQRSDREDVQRSFFSTATPTSTMPGSFNVGLDAEIPEVRTHAAAVSDPPVDERQCRICLGGADEEDTLGRLISPCLCKGSMKYVHVECDDYDDDELVQLKESVVIFKTPDSLRAVFRIDKTHMVFGSFFVSIIGFIQLLLSTIWMGGGGGVFRIGGFGLGGGRRRARGERQREAGIGGVLMVVILIFGLFKSVYMTYQFVHRVSRRVLAKAELMVLEVQ